MKIWLKGVLVLILATGLVWGMASDSFAVFGDGAGDGGKLVDSNSNPMANVKVRITQLNSDGTSTTRETETDDRGFFVLPWFGGAVTNIQFGTGGKWYTFGGPFWDMDAIPSSERPGTCPKCEILDFHLPDADAVTSSPSEGVWVSEAMGYGEGDPWYKFAINYGYKFGRMNTKLDRITGGNSTVSDGDDIIVGQSEIRFDGRVYYGPLANRGYLGNLGNLLFFGYLANIGNIGNVGKIGISDCFGGVQVGVGLSAKDTGLGKMEHFNDRKDTNLRQKYNGSIKPYVGCKVADLNKLGYFNLLGGPTFSWWEYLFTSDELGTLVQNRQNNTKYGAAFGVEYNNHFSYGALSNWLGLGPRDRVYGGLQLSYWAEYVPGYTLPGITGPISNSTYVPSVEGAWINTFYGGWGIYF